MTWKSPDDRTESQTTLPLKANEGTHFKTLGVKRGADIGSDYNLLIDKLALTLRKAKVDINLGSTTMPEVKEAIQKEKLQSPKV